MWQRIRQRTRFRPAGLAVTTTGLLLLMIVGVAVRSAPPASAAGNSLRTAAEAQGRQFGTALSPTSNLTGNAKYMATTTREFDLITPGNEMKWGSVEPNQGQFNWGPADQLVAFAQANNMKVRGHNLVWHSQLPNWFQNGNFSATQVLSLMDQHIATEAGRFAGKVIDWDVVNEPFNEDGSFRADIFSNASNATGSGLSGYIARALRDARAADPNAKLYLNDFNTEGMNAKSNAMFNLVQSLKQQGVPIDGVGLESHFIEGANPSGIQQNIQRLVGLGVQVRITELDDRFQSLPPSSAGLQQQATEYANVVKACLAVTGCVGITVWGFTDLDSWIPGAFPGQGAADLFDNNIDPKPAYNATLTALGGSSTTPTPTPTGTPTPTPTTTPTPTPTGTGGSVTATPVVASNSPFFNEEDVRLSNTTSITALTVTIVIQRTTGVSFSGQYNTVGGQILQSNSSTASAITYTFTLASGQTLSAGSGRLFAAQTGGNGTAHPTAADTFTVTATSGGATTTSSGHF
ncbi:MAG TPA: endo-1,4-beta-xylanase [Candidatus Dormibacteraeota bacterium]|nr:endo-1,4-beta-xylanase [Candidatus Dormibacteraeota bacterium]